MISSQYPKYDTWIDIANISDMDISMRRKFGTFANMVRLVLWVVLSVNVTEHGCENDESNLKTFL